MKKVEPAVMQQLDYELNTTVHMSTYERMAGLIYVPDDSESENENFYNSDGNVIDFS